MSKTNKDKIKELQEIYNNFLEKLNELRGDRNIIIEKISKRLEEKEIKENLDKLNKI